MDLVFEVDTGRARVVGAMSVAEMVRLDPGTRLFGVRFRPARLPLLLNVAAHELTDCDTPADSRVCGSATQLCDLICAAADARGRAAAVAAFIAEPRVRLRPPDARVERAVRLLECSAGATSIGDVARHVNVGERQLERLFAERIGLRPKLFSRIQRLQRALALAAARRCGHAELAAHAGYSDESHLVREFQALCAAPPTQVIREWQGRQDVTSP